MLAMCWVTRLSALQNAASSANRIVTAAVASSPRPGRADPPEVVGADLYVAEARRGEPVDQCLRLDGVVGVARVERDRRLPVAGVGGHQQAAAHEHAGQLGADAP